jgi:hypothetical protein
MLKPFNKYPNANFYHYSIQLSLYKFLIEKNSPIRIDGGMKIVQFVETNDSYVVYDCIDFTKEIVKFLGV